MSDKVQEIVEKLEQLTVAELAAVVKAMEEKFGISAAAPMAAGGGAAPAGEAKTEFNVVLKAFGEKKIDVIKAVREITGLGLAESKALVEAAPKAVKEGVKKEEADEIKGKLEAAGATAEIQ